MAGKSKSRLLNWIDSHPLPVVVTIVISTAGLTWRVVSYFDEERASEKITILEDHLASINRRLVGGDYLNVAKLLVPQAERNRVPPRSEFYREDNFYALTLPGWSHEKLKDTSVFERFFTGGNVRPEKDVTKLAPVHLWQRGGLARVEGHSMLQKASPCIYVQKLSVAKLAMQLSLEETDWTKKSAVVVESSSLENIDEETAKKFQAHYLFQGDLVGAVLAETFAEVFENLRFVANTDVRLIAINKISNVLYCQILITLHDVTVNNEKLPEYYINVENIVICTPDDLYTLFDFIPGKDPVPRGAVAGEITTWLDGFAILAK